MSNLLKMEKRTMRTTLLAVVSFMFFAGLTSCLDDDDDSVPQYMELGVTEYGPDNEKLVFTDAETTLQLRDYPAGFEFTDSVRILMKYSVFKTGDENDIYDYMVDALSIQNIVLKDIIELNEENRDTIGTDQFFINDIWISGGFLNVDFAFYGNDEVHYFNVVKDPDDQTGDETEIYLQVRHNARGDKMINRYRGLMSFYLEPLQVEGYNKVTLIFENQEFYTAPYEEFEVEYEY
ncbi:MAG: hypothetical protein PWQ17_197 [Anaerophaga sp.]|nr:hypothetical protein [Anaerophaga sp.]